MATHHVPEQISAWVDVHGEDVAVLHVPAQTEWGLLSIAAFVGTLPPLVVLVFGAVRVLGPTLLAVGTALLGWGLIAGYFLLPREEAVVDRRRRTVGIRKRGTAVYARTYDFGELHPSVEKYITSRGEILHSFVFKSKSTRREIVDLSVNDLLCAHDLLEFYTNFVLNKEQKRWMNEQLDAIEEKAKSNAGEPLDLEEL